jgi:peptidase E
MKLLLTSNFPMKNNKAVADWIDQHASGDSILYAGYSETASKYVKKVEDYGFNSVDFLNIRKVAPLQNLHEYSAIVLHGGNPFSIKEFLKISGFDLFFRNYDGLIVTISGSSCVLSRQFSLIASFYPGWKGDDTQGLGFFPYEVLPHSQRYKKKKSEIEVYSQKERLYVLPDGSAVAYDGKTIQGIQLPPAKANNLLE